jgi:ATP/ADP translocase
LLDLQDVLVVTAPGSGAEIIPFLKTWVNLPAAIAFTVGYAQVGSIDDCSIAVREPVKSSTLHNLS